jgi:hypothetical protein
MRRGISRLRARNAHGFWGSAVAAILAAVVSTNSYAGPLIWIGDSANNLFTVDTATAATKSVGNMGGLLPFTDIAFAPSGDLWGTTSTGFYKINPTNAATTFVGNTGLFGANALTFGPNGTLYAASSSSTSLYTINTTTGAATALPGSMGTGSAGDLAFNGGQLYLSGLNGQLVQVGLAAAITGTNKGAFGVPNVFGLATDQTGRLLAASNKSIYEVNPSNGRLTSLASYSGFSMANGATVLPGSTPPPPPQTLFLEFSETLTPIPSALTKWWGLDVGVTAVYTKPKAALLSSEIPIVVNNVSAIFAPFHISVTAEKPTFEDYSTIYIGGSNSHLPAEFQGNTVIGTLGLADKLDYQNKDKKDFALVLSSNVKGTPDHAFLPFLSQVIAHEAGHILGLHHVVPPGELMYPFNDEFRIDITDADVQRGEINPSGGVSPVLSGCQNSYQELANNVGLKLGTPKPKGDFCDSFIDGLLFKYGLFGTLFDATLALISGDHVGPSYFELGDLLAGSELTLTLPVHDGTQIALLASSTNGGARDVISSPLGSDAFGGFASLDALSPADFLGVFSASNPVLHLNLYRANSDGGFTSFGSFSFGVEQSVPEPSTWTLLSLGLLLVLFGRHRVSRAGMFAGIFRADSSGIHVLPAT